MEEVAASYSALVKLGSERLSDLFKVTQHVQDRGATV